MSEPVRRRHSPAVYRRRRLTVLLVVIVVIVGIVLLVWQPWNAGASQTDPSPDPTPSASSSPGGAATATPLPSPTASQAEPEADVPEGDAGAVACTAGMVEVAGITDKESYAAGENPQLSISLTNTGGVPCTMNVGTTTQTFTISSGDDVWWRSTDCQTEPSDQTVTVDAGQTVTSVTPLTWDRTRSSVSTCGDVDRQTAPGGGSSFHLKVSIGGVESSGSRQFVLN